MEMNDTRDPENYIRYTAGQSDAGRTVRDIIRNEFGLSLTKLRSVKYDPQGILLNGQRVTVRAVLREGDVLEVLAADSSMREVRLIPWEMPLDILYEDEAMIIVNKPSGMVCHPSIGHYTDTAANALQYYFNETGQDRARVHLTGRLDKDTSGAVLVAKNSVADSLIKEQQEAGAYRKTYLALAHGAYDEPEGVIQTPMRVAEGPEDGIKRMVRAGADGLAAHTQYRVLRELDVPGMGTVSLLEVTISTGRMHQIRFHMADLGHPLLGDRLYGDGSDGCGRAMLHAHRIQCLQPFAGIPVDITAPLPEDFSSLNRKLI